MRDDGFYVLKVVLTAEDWARLEALGKAKNAKPTDCVRGMIRACQPGGSGWQHPTEAAKGSKA